MTVPFILHMCDFEAIIWRANTSSFDGRKAGRSQYADSAAAASLRSPTQTKTITYSRPAPRTCETPGPPYLIYRLYPEQSIRPPVLSSLPRLPVLTESEATSPHMLPPFPSPPPSAPSQTPPTLVHTQTPTPSLCHQTFHIHPSNGLYPISAHTTLPVHASQTSSLASPPFT
jgi:hypothetical protein